MHDPGVAPVTAIGGVVPDWLAAVASGGMGALVLYAAQLLLQWRRQLDQERSSRSLSGLEIKKHRDGLTVQMLEMARDELRTAWAEIALLRTEMRNRDDEIERLRRIEIRFKAYEEALSHIEALVMAEITGDREAAEHAARIYLAKMEALKLTLGDQANAEQVKRAGERRIGRDRT
jgi:hypothetical protein